jgi:hypothetical protein
VAAGDPRKSAAREKVLLGIGCAVTAVWAVAVLVQVIFPSHVVPYEVHGIMLVIASGFFGSAAVAGRRSGTTS